MSRNDVVREAVLERDGYSCQICGYDGRDLGARSYLHAHHIQPLGMGGSDERDTEDNMITLCSKCHSEIHAGAKTIARWGDGEFEVVDIESRKIDHRHVWFHRRRFAEALEPVEARVSCLHRIDGDVARDVYALWHDDAWQYLDPEARSWKEYCASRGWDGRKATRLAKRYSQGLELGIDWYPGETEAEYRHKLPQTKREHFYLRLLANGGYAWYRTAHEEELRDTMAFGDVLIKVGKTLWGVRADGGKLIDPDGIPMPVIEEL